MKRLLHLVPLLILACTLFVMPGCSSEPSGKPEKAASPASGKEQPRKRFLAFGGGPTRNNFV